MTSELFLLFEKFCNGPTTTDEAKTLKNFLDNNDNLIICPVDKRKDLIILEKK